MKEKIRIGIDIDEVLINTIDSVVDFYNIKYNHAPLKNDEIIYKKSDKIQDIVDMSPEDAELFLLEYFNSEYHINCLPIEDSKNILSDLIDFNISAITFRSKEVSSVTLDWLDKNFKNIFSDVHFLGDKIAGGDSIKHLNSKGEYAKDLGIKIFIEDSLKNSLDIASYGISVILLDKPWNQEENLPENIHRVKNWSEILEKINQLAQ